MGIDTICYRVPMYIKAQSEDKLVQSMLNLNIKTGSMIKYTDIQKVGKFWYAWYLGDAGKMVQKKIAKEMTNGTTGDNSGS